MKHKELLERVCAELHEPWMDQQDKELMNSELMRKFGAQFEKDIETGIANGYTVEQQEALVRSIFMVTKP